MLVCDIFLKYTLNSLKSFDSVHVVRPYSSIDSTAAWKKTRFILSYRSIFHMIDSLSIAVHAFARGILTPFSVDKTLLPRCVNLSSIFRGSSFKVEMAPSRLKHMYSFFFFFFFWRSRRDQCLQLLAPGYAAEICVGQAYLKEVLCHLHNFCGISSVFGACSVNPLSFIISIDFWSI